MDHEVSFWSVQEAKSSKDIHKISSAISSRAPCSLQLPLNCSPAFPLRPVLAKVLYSHLPFVWACVVFCLIFSSGCLAGWFSSPQVFIGDHFHLFLLLSSSVSVTYLNEFLAWQAQCSSWLRVWWEQKGEPTWLLSFLLLFTVPL